MHFGQLCLQRFLQRFIDPTSNEDENAGLDLNEPLYMQKLEEVLHLAHLRTIVQTEEGKPRGLTFLLSLADQRRRRPSAECQLSARAVL